VWKLKKCDDKIHKEETWILKYIKIKNKKIKCIGEKLSSKICKIISVEW